MNKIIFRISLICIAVLFIAINVYALDVQSIDFKNGEFSLKYSSSKKLNYNKMIFKNPTRLVVDIIGVDDCSACKKGVLVLNDNQIKAKINMHAKEDVVYNNYKKPTLRVVFVFGKRSSVFDNKIENNQGSFKIAFDTKNTGSSNVLERVSFRKFKTYEMVVALLKNRPDYSIEKDKNVVYVTIDNAYPTTNALEEQNLSNVSSGITKIVAAKIDEDTTRYAIHVKSENLLRRDYSDKRHVYVIFNVFKNKNLSDVSEFGNNNNEKILNIKSDSGKLLTKRSKKKYTGKKISFNVKNANIHDIFRVFAQVSNLNFITSNDVKGSLTMELHDVPWDQAFDIILQQKGLVAEKSGNIMRITTASKMQSEKKQELKAIEEKQELDRAKNAITEVIDLNYVTPDYAMKIVNNLLYKKKSKSGFIVSDVKNNAVICHDTKENIEKIKQIVNTIDKRKKAVEIDARIVEISKTFERQLGIQWGGNYANFNIKTGHTFIGVGGSSSPVSIGSSGNIINPSANFTGNNFAVSLPTTLSDAPQSTLSLAMGNVLANYNLDLKLTAGEVEGYSKVLSSPRVITLDNEPAKIESGQSIPYQESAGASGATSVSFKDATLSLEVTPHITNNKQIILKIKVEKNSADFSHAVNGEPPINKNSVETSVVLTNGQTIVLGGLIQKTNLKSTSGVPGLMRIPFFGWLFKTKRVYNPENELFIFVTPKIVTNR